MDKSDGVYIKQKFELLEALTGWETPNTYKVYRINDKGDKVDKDAMFKAKEKSGWCMRMCCPGNMRAFEMKIKHSEGKH